MNEESYIMDIIREDDWMMDILHTVRGLDLPDWWVCAGFVRSKLWDVLHDYKKRTPLADVDVIYYDAASLSEPIEKQLEQQLRSLRPEIPWSVKNQARMHVVSGLPPYSCSVDAISKFPETATSLGVALDASGQLQLAAPWGVSDVLQAVLRPTVYYEQGTGNYHVYEQRIVKKNWQATWPKVN
ncbi:hypothetical protein BBD42_30000 [Paenibacillus sp. BIHB 4019]|uniref:Nucleotidyltransferase family protein n=1 Tax=Paenibacillus sp. BIHB 4019 TaxID=1870819 RepID=A0A1B2DRD0_9BACL|nr:nucleotidyltransferase family protein [Paenibacillus sp. BIHB 4019]ANY70261.1 hypothetical protein BBD42_30000 [Paenibacillus sp. BIHB 4019]